MRKITRLWVGAVLLSMVGFGCGEINGPPEDAVKDEPTVEVTKPTGGASTGTTEPLGMDAGTKNTEAPVFNPGGVTTTGDANPLGKPSANGVQIPLPSPETKTPSVDQGPGGLDLNLNPPAKATPPVNPLEKADAATLIQKLNTPAMRDVAADAIKLQGATIVPKLVKMLDDKNPQVRAGAIFALGTLGKDATSALPTLKKLAKEDKAAPVRSAAKFAITAIEK